MAGTPPRRDAEVEDSCQAEAERMAKLEEKTATAIDKKKGISKIDTTMDIASDKKTAIAIEKVPPVKRQKTSCSFDGVAAALGGPPRQYDPSKGESSYFAERVVDDPF